MGKNVVWNLSGSHQTAMDDSPMGIGCRALPARPLGTNDSFKRLVTDSVTRGAWDARVLSDGCHWDSPLEAFLQQRGLRRRGWRWWR